MGQQTMAEFFSGSSEAGFRAATAAELCGEAGDDGKSSGLPNFLGGSVGQGGGGGATTTGDFDCGARMVDTGAASGDKVPTSEVRERPANWAEMSKSQKHRWGRWKK